jgi:cytidyltransferase-like protein
MKPQFSSSVVGGTFDHFHKGHAQLLNTVFSQSKHVTIGISTEKLYKNKFFVHTIESFETREHYVKSYLKENDFENRAEIIAIDSIYGTTLEDRNLDAIFVTDDNKNAASIINEKRKEIDFPPLQVLLVPFLKANDGQTISSERIRRGIMDRNGFVYSEVFKKKSLHLPEKLRSKLRKPIGPVTKNIHEQKTKMQNAPMIISVGDIVTFSLVESGMYPDLSIVDFQTRRHDLKINEQALLEKITKSGFVCTNAAGKIEIKAAEAIFETIENFFESGEKQAITIKGEEDLLTLPTILFAPLGSIVIYGQYNEGAVFVDVTEQKKEEILHLINQFE